MLFGNNNLSVPDKSVFLKHIEITKSPCQLFYNAELDFAREVKAQFPAMEVIYRNWPDGDIHNHLTPEQWLEKRADEAQGGLMLYTTNEAGVGQSIVDWHVKLMQLCIPLKIKLCVLNAATGTWDTPDMPRLRPLLQLASDHRDLFAVAVHGYAGGVITSGIKGGNPDEAGKTVGVAGIDLTNRMNWSKVLPTDTFFHIGRHKMFVEYCQREDLKPRFGLTEIGFDFLGDIGAYLRGIGQRTGQMEINGWRTLVEYWKQLFPDWSSEMAYIEQMKWAEKNLLRGLDFALNFASGTDGNWANYRIDNSAIPVLQEAAARTTQETPVVIPPKIDPTPPPQPVDLPEPTLPPPPTFEPALQLADVLPEIEAIYAAYGALIARIKAA